MKRTARKTEAEGEKTCTGRQAWKYPQGSDKIDELEQALEFCKYGRDEARKEADRMLERERHAVHHSETYKRLIDRTREVDKVRKEAKQLREALQTIAFPVKHFQQEAEKAGATLDGEMVMALSNDAGWMKDVARKALEEGGE